MGWLLTILGAPAVGPLKLVQWVAEKIDEVVEKEKGDENQLKADLQELQIKLENEEITEEEYNKNETEIMKKIQTLKVKKTS